MPLEVVFSRADSESEVPLENGMCRSESIAISGSSEEPTVSTLQCNDSENVVTLLADVDCYVSIGPASALDAANVQPGANRRPLKANDMKEYRVKPGWKVEVIER